MAQAPRALSPGAERDPGARAVGPSARRRTPPRGGALGARRGAGSPSHGEPSRLALSPSPVPDERGARGRGAPGGGLNLNLHLNLDRTEVRAVMKPLQGEAQVGRARTLSLSLRAVFVLCSGNTGPARCSAGTGRVCGGGGGRAEGWRARVQVDRFAELQERYNLGKKHAAVKRRARNKLHMQVQAKQAAPSKEDAYPEPAANQNPYERPRNAAPRRGGRGEQAVEQASPFAPRDNMVIANGFSHAQKLRPDNPYAEKGSGLNHNQNQRAMAANPYLIEAARARAR